MGIDLSRLNKQQREAVNYNSGHSMIIAGAGGGKTTTLIHKVGKKVEDGTLESRIYISTFTRKAAEEFTDRLIGLVGEYSALKLNMGTFHNLCNTLNDKLVRKVRGYKRKQKLIKPFQVWNHHRKVIKHYDLASKDIKDIIQRISLWKNEGRLVKDLMELPEVKDTRPQSMKLASWVFSYKEYEDYKKRNNLIDFDDMLLNFWLELSNPKNEKHARSVCESIDYICLDESQDSNALQYKILDRILELNPSCQCDLIGDDQQAIYSFRGGSVPEMRSFIERNNLKIFTIETNYRSTKKIVNYGNNLISFNTEQIEKVMNTNNPEGDPAIKHVSPSTDDEAEWVLDQVSALISDGYDPKEIFILLRINSQARAITDKFVLNDIPHYVHSNYSFYNRREVKDIISYCKILYNPEMAEMDDFKRIINKPTRYLSSRVVNKIDDYCDMEDYESFWHGLYESYRVDGLRDFERENIEKLAVLIQDKNKYIHERGLTTSNIIKMVVEDVGYGKYLQESMEELSEDPDDDKGLNIDALYDGAERFTNPEDWFQYVESVSKNHNKEKEEDCVQIMSAHKCKGREADAVFILGMCDRIYPFYKSAKTKEGVEEERRVAYVAATRAREKLFLSAINGKFGRINVRPSPFIQELEGVRGYERREKKNVILKKANG